MPFGGALTVAAIGAGAQLGSAALSKKKGGGGGGSGGGASTPGPQPIQASAPLPPYTGPTKSLDESRGQNKSRMKSVYGYPPE